MLYLINHNVTFRPEDGAIWEGGNKDEPLMLTLTESRLLIFLIEEQGRVISRNEIFHDVWDRWGLDGSNNSLNHFISRLRKVFAACELPNDAIKTVPRIGFMLSEDLDIQKIDAPSFVEKGNSYIKFFIWSTYILITALLFYILIVYLPISDNKKIPTQMVGNYQNCNVYSLTSPLDVNKNKLLNNVDKIALEFNIDCSLPGTIFLQIDKKALYSDGGVIYIAHCTGRKRSISDCISFMDKNWHGV